MAGYASGSTRPTGCVENTGAGRPLGPARPQPRQPYPRLLVLRYRNHRRHTMADTSQIHDHMDVISSDRKMVGKVDHLDGPDRIKLTRQSSPNGDHHHIIPVGWIDHV